MAYIAKARGDNWELRESHATASGPRSRTLASFKVLDDEVFARAEQAASGPLDREAVERVARRVGAPVQAQPADSAVRALLRALDAGEKPRAGLLNALAAGLASAVGQASDAARAAAAWAGASNDDRSAALFDLLLLADALPAPRAERALIFPRLQG
ncbi:MAG: hypothetical protein ACRDKI_01835 [Solirubrobacterales bacterium]